MEGLLTRATYPDWFQPLAGAQLLLEPLEMSVDRWVSSGSGPIDSLYPIGDGSHPDCDVEISDE